MVELPSLQLFGAVSEREDPDHVVEHDARGTVMGPEEVRDSRGERIRRLVFVLVELGSFIRP